MGKPASLVFDVPVSAGSLSPRGGQPLDISEILAAAGLRPVGSGDGDGDATGPDGADTRLPTALFAAATQLIAYACEHGVVCNTAEAELDAAIAAERNCQASDVLRTKLLAQTDRSAGARKRGTTTAQIVAELRRIPLKEAADAVVYAQKQAQFPRALAAAAEGRMSTENLHTTVRTLEQLRPHYSEQTFAGVEKEILAAAHMPVPTEFKKRCRRTLAEVDSAIARSDAQARARRKAHTWQIRGLWVTPIEDGEFGARISGILPTEYLRVFLPALEDKAARIGRAQRQEKGRSKADDRRYRLLDALMESVTGTKVPKPDPIDGDGVDDLLYHDEHLSKPKQTERVLSGPRRQIEAVTPNAVPRVERDRELWDTTAADCGRTQRTAPPALRRLLAIRDGGCVHPHCNVPPPLCEGHHVKPWSDGGGTDLGNMVLLCHHHHYLVEHPPDDTRVWRIRFDDNGIPVAIPPEHIDPEQRPVYHPRFTSAIINIALPDGDVDVGGEESHRRSVRPALRKRRANVNPPPEQESIPA